MGIIYCFHFSDYCCCFAFDLFVFMHPLFKLSNVGVDADRSGPPV